MVAKPASVAGMQWHEEHTRLLFPPSLVFPEKRKKNIPRHGMEMDLNGRQSAREKGKPKYYKCLFHQFVHGPADVQTPQITIVLTNAQEHHRNTGGVHHADKRADHVAHRVALGDDEAVHADAVVAELAL